MRLSVLIPIYNQRVVELATVLSGQLAVLGEPAEILLYDDGSSNDWKQENSLVAALPGCRYLEMPQNLGRARIRNRLATDARGEYLLFLDGDAAVEDPLFLKRYLQEAAPDQVVCGVKEHSAALPPPDHRLHWLYGRLRESVPARIRQRHPWHAFNTFSFLIPRMLFLSVRLDESLREYGHEDTVFGLELQRRGIPVRHTDISARHEGVDSSSVFLQKNRAAVANLLRLADRYPVLWRDVKLLRALKWVQRLGLAGPLRWWFARNRGRLEANLLSPNPKLWMLDGYKLGEIVSSRETMKGDGAGKLNN